MDRLEILTGDITKSQADAIICMAHTFLEGGSDLGETVLSAAGMKEAAMNCKTRSAILLSGGSSLTACILYASGPPWKGGRSGEPTALKECYNACLELAEENKCMTLDIPSIPTEIHDSQLFQAATATLASVVDFLKTHSIPERVRIICQDHETTNIYKQVYNFWFAFEKSERMDSEDWRD